MDGFEIRVFEGWWPHGGLHPALKKSTCPEEIVFQAISDAVLVTSRADVRGGERLVVHRVVMRYVLVAGR